MTLARRVICALVALAAVAYHPSAAAAADDDAVQNGRDISSIAALATAVGATESELLELSDRDMIELLTVDHRGLVGVLGRRKILKELAARADHSLRFDDRGVSALEEIAALQERVDNAEAALQRRHAVVVEEIQALRARVDELAKVSELSQRRQLQGTNAGNDDDTCLSSDEIAYAAMRSSQAMSAAFGDFHDRVLPTLMADTTGGETLACRCAICADTPVNGSLCLPWMDPEPCDCLGAQAQEHASGRAFTSATGCLGTPDQGYNDPTTTQLFPVSELTNRGLPSCCREEWPHNVTVEQVSTADSEAYSQDDITMKICGVLTFKWHGFENVEQVSDNWDPDIQVGRRPVARPGVGIPQENQYIRSGDPTTGGEFQWTFSDPGEYYFRSYFTNSIRVKVTVMDCSYCTVTAGYDGEQPRSTMIALSSRTPGNYHLRVADLASLGHATVYYNQTLTVTATGAPIGQLALLDASIHVMSGGNLILDHVHVTSWVAVDRGGTFDNRGSLVEMDALPVPRAVEPFPECLPRMVGSLIYDFSESGNSGMLQCGQAGQWSRVSTTIYDGQIFEDWVIATKENVLHQAATSSSFWNGGPGTGNAGYYGRPGTFGLLLREEITDDVLTQAQNTIKAHFSEPSGQISRQESLAFMRYIVGGGQKYVIRGDDEIRRTFPGGRIPWRCSPYIGVRTTDEPYSQITSSSNYGFGSTFSMIGGGHLALANIKFQSGGSYSGHPQSCTQYCSYSAYASFIQSQGSNSAAVVEIENCEISGFNGRTTDGQGQIHWVSSGGAISMESSDGGSRLTVVDSVFSSNRGGAAGAIYVGSNHVGVHISNTEFHGNSPCQCRSSSNCCDSRSPPWNNAEWHSSMAVRVPRGSSSEGMTNDCGNIHGVNRASQQWSSGGSNPSYYCGLHNGD